MNYILIFIGGGLGSVLRFELGNRITKMLGPSFPFATISINVMSCFILGILLSLFGGKSNMDQSVKFLLAVGFCGGFSTFSTFTWETFELIKTGHLLYAGANILLSVFLCLVSLWLGSSFSRFI